MPVFVNIISSVRDFFIASSMIFFTTSIYITIIMIIIIVNITITIISAIMIINGIKLTTITIYIMPTEIQPCSNYSFKMRGLKWRGLLYSKTGWKA